MNKISKILLTNEYLCDIIRNVVNLGKVNGIVIFRKTTIFNKLLVFTLLLTLLLTFVSCGENKIDNIKVKIIDIKLTDEEYAFLIQKGNVSLVESMNAFMNEIKADGTFDKLVSKYFEGKGEKIGYPVTTNDVENTEDKFIVVTNCPFEPFEYRGEDGKIYGLDIEIAAAYAEKMGLELVIKDIDFGAIFTQIETGYADIGMAGITMSEDRKEIYDFTTPYYQASQKLIVSYDNTDFDNCKTAQDVEDVLVSFENKKVGYQGSTTGDLYINGNEDWGFDGFTNLSGNSYPTAQLAVTDLINGNLYAVIVDEGPGNMIVEKMNSNSTWKAKFENFFSTLSNEHYLKVLGEGLINTIRIAILGLIIGVFIGTIIAIIRIAPQYKLIYKILDKICSVYVTIFRGTPIVAQLLIAYYVIIPSLNLQVGKLAVAIIVFGMNSGAYVSEIMRGGLNSVDRGQLEAGRALGMTYSTTMIKIVVPQAIKNILPTLGNELISLIKETSVLSFITVYDLYKALLEVGMVNYDSMVPYIMMGLIYIVLVLIISAGIKLLERRFAKSDRN